MTDISKFEDLLEQVEVKNFLHRFETEVLPQINQSNVIMCLASDKPDAKQCIEMGAALLLDKPIIVAVAKGRKLPENLRKVARSIVEIDDFGSSEAITKLQRALEDD